MGRPHELDDLKAERIVKSIRAGNSRVTAAKAAGISDTSIYEWVRRGRKGEEPFAQFARRIRAAEAEAIEAMVQIVVEAARDDWRAAHAWLKARVSTWRDRAAAAPANAKAIESLPDDVLLEAAGLRRIDNVVDIKKAGGG